MKAIIDKQEHEKKELYEHLHRSSPASPASSPVTTTKDESDQAVKSVTEGVDNLLLAASVNAKVVPATGFNINIDFSTMANHANLTALPRVPNANLNIADADSTTTSSSKAMGSLPVFIQTPTPLMAARINSVRCLTNESAYKRTLLVEFGFEDDVDYAPGDSFGIWAPNDESLVRGILAELGVSEQEMSKAIKLEGKGRIYS